MILVGDVGGTRARLALCPVDRIELTEKEVFPSAESGGLGELLERYLAARGIRPVGAVLGVPGPVLGGVVRTTNLPWQLRESDLSRRIGAPVLLLNDLEAACRGIGLLPAETLTSLQPGEASDGAVALLAPGTGLGQGVLVRDERGAPLALPSEGAHVEFGPRDEEQIELLRFLLRRHGHVSYERIVSGPGLGELHAFMVEGASLGTDHLDPASAPAPQVAAGALRAECPACLGALRLFSSILGAEAGNLALKALATGGVYIAGGVVPRLGPLLDVEGLLAAFRDKGRYRALMESIPLALVDDEDLGLRGAALAAESLSRP